jgi:cell wall assembly regulator SMI1
MSKKWRNLTMFDDEGQADIKNIEAFEKKYNICFPKSYKGLMLEHNGAYFEESYFDFINKRGQEDGRSFGFDYFGNVENPSDKNIEYYNQHLQDPIYYGVPGLIGIGSTAEGDTLCFDYRDDPKTCEPKVVLLVHDEYEEDENGNTHMLIEPIANSFDEFLNMLYKYEDDEE